jgi:hypothetical protein
MSSMQTTDVTLERLQRLAGIEAPGDARVLSLYLNLDPRSGFATQADRASAVNSLLDTAARAVEGEEDLGHDAHIALREDVTRAREALDANLADGWAEGAHALALFVCGPADLFEVVKLPRPQDNKVVISRRPAIAPLAETGPIEPWAVLVLDGDDARLLEATGDRLDEVAAERGDLRGRTQAGGMSAQRYERSVGQEVDEFLRGVVDMLRRADDQRAYARIFVGTGERMYAELQQQLPAPLKERIAARFDVGADWESPQDIAARLEPLRFEVETRTEAEALARAAHPGVRGLSATLPALYERRVETLLVEPGLEHPGVVCPRCRWAMAEERGTCPVDGERMLPEPNLVEWAVGVAVEQDATVLPVRRHDDLGEHDGIGAALRF